MTENINLFMLINEGQEQKECLVPLISNTTDQQGRQINKFVEKLKEQSPLFRELMMNSRFLQYTDKDLQENENIRNKIV